jgi:hypothetical protein
LLMTSLKYLEVFVTDGLWCSLKKDHISDFWAIWMCKMWSVNGFRKSTITFLTLILIMYLLLIMYNKDMTSLSECTIIRGINLHLSMLVQYKVNDIIISSKCTLFCQKIPKGQSECFVDHFCIFNPLFIINVLYILRYTTDLSVLLWCLQCCLSTSRSW